MPTLTTSIQQVPEVLAEQLKETKGTQIREEEVKFPLLADDIILPIEQHNDFTIKLSELINSVQFLDIKPTYKNQFHVYTLTTNYLKKNLRNQFHL